VDQVVAEENDAQEGEPGRQAVAESRAGEVIDPAEASGEPEGQQGEQGNDGLDDPEAGVGARVVLRLGVFFRVEDVGEFLRRLRAELAEVENGGDEVEIPQREERDEDDEAKGVGFHGWP
jgi:hypothetical protein